MDKEIWKLDLDVSEFTEKALKAKGTIQAIGDKKNLEELIEGLAQASIVLGTVGAAAFGVKQAMSLVFEAESIKQINLQFENLAKSAGIAGDKLHDGLVNAGKGLIDDTDLMKAANKAMVDFGADAAKLPQLLEIARTQTALFGGDVLSNFEAINQAIATGMTRGLKNLGLVVDQKRAQIEYAKALGTTVDALSDNERRTALLNAVLEKGSENQRNAGKSVKEATNAWKEFQVALNEVKETAILAFDKIAGPSVIEKLKSLSGWAGEARTRMKAAFSEGAESGKAGMEILEKKILSLKGHLVDLDTQGKKQGFLDRIWNGSVTAQIEKTNRELMLAESSLKALQSLGKEGTAKGPAESPSGPASTTPEEASKPDLLANARKLESASKLELELLRLREKRINDEVQTADSIAQVDEGLAEKRKVIADIAAASERETRAQMELGEITHAQGQARILELESDKAAKLKAIEEDLLRARLRALDNYVRASQTAASGIERGFRAESQRATLEMGNFGKRGEEMFKSLTKNATSSLMELGAGTKSATDVMKGFIFGFLADRAEAEGALLLASSVWPPNPAGLAAGGALLVLAGFLRSQAGGGGSKGAPSASGSSGGSASSGGGRDFSSSVDESKPQLEEAKARRSVTINVAGNMWGSDQTKRELLEMIRQETDATDFQYNQIG